MGNITKLALRNAMVRAARLVKESSGARTAREWRSGKGAQMLRLRFYVPQCCGKRDLGRRANDPGESELWRAHISLNPTPALYPVVRVASGRGNEDTPPIHSKPNGPRARGGSCERSLSRLDGTSDHFRDFLLAAPDSNCLEYLSLSFRLAPTCPDGCRPVFEGRPPEPPGPSCTHRANFPGSANSPAQQARGACRSQLIATPNANAHLAPKWP